MLHREHLGVAIGYGGRKTRVRYGQGRNGDVYRLRQINPAKNNACVRCSRPQGQLNALAAVQANTNGFGE